MRMRLVSSTSIVGDDFIQRGAIGSIGENLFQSGKVMLNFVESQGSRGAEITRDALPLQPSQ